MTLIAKDLSCRRGDRLILTGVCLELNAGDCLILRGPNGVGKSTLLRVLSGLSAPESGALTVDADQIAYAGHLDAVKAQLSVAENLQFWSGIYGTNLLSETLARFDLTDLADRAAFSLSAGQKRRLGLARLHLTGRKIWLLDEPTVSLDSAQVAIFENLFSAHCTGGGIAIISTHLNLKIPGAVTLDLAQFIAAPGNLSSPFLAEFT